MDREIKFRAFYKGQIIYNINLEVTRGKHYFTDGKDILLDVPLMQSTGLKDKNGKEIYEGDILSNTKHKLKFKVQWGIENESYSGWAGNWLDKDFISPLFNKPLENCKIIGNIYENPELLTNPT